MSISITELGELYGVKIEQADTGNGTKKKYEYTISFPKVAYLSIKLDKKLRAGEARDFCKTYLKEI